MASAWCAGFHDALRTLRHPEVSARPTGNEDVLTFDFERDDRDGMLGLPLPPGEAGEAGEAGKPNRRIANDGATTKASCATS